MRLINRLLNTPLNSPSLRLTQSPSKAKLSQLAFESVFKDSGAWDYVLLKSYDSLLRWAGVYSIFWFSE